MDAKQLPSRPNLEQYKKQAKDLVRACKSDANGRATWAGLAQQFGLTERQVIQRIKKHHPRLGNLADSDILSARFALADAQWVIAREHGFNSWPKFVKHIEAVTRDSSPVSQFESAVEAIITGDITTIESLLRENPELVRERSTRAHRATLLHYVAANGVEDYRQKTPKNAVLVAETLLRAGAEVDALAETYGGGAQQTTLNLLVSSVHPAKVGAQAALVETLLDFGAAINGVEDDESPLITALAFDYQDAAEALARRGARVDNIVTAASLGREDLVRSFVNADGSLKAGVPLLAIRWLQLPKDPKANMELALVWAARLGRAGVVEFLLQKGVDPGVKDGWGYTALHSAASNGHLEAVEALLEWNAPLEAKNGYDGTALDQTIWTTVHEGLVENHVSIIQRLIAVGAKVHPDWLRADLNPPLDERVAEALRRHRRNE